MTYSKSNPPSKIVESGFSGQIPGAQWLMQVTDDMSTIAQTPGYITNAAQLGMQLGDIVWIRQTSNQRSYRSSIVSMSPTRQPHDPPTNPAGGAATLGDYTMTNVGQVSAVEAGWSALLNSQTGTGVRFVGAPPPIAVSGTFGAGGSVRLEGSNDLATWTALSIPARTSAGTFQSFGANDTFVYYRPNVTAGDGTTSLTVTF